MLTRVYIQSELLPDIKFIEINEDYVQLEAASFAKLWEICRADPWQRPADKLSLKGRWRWSAIAAKLLPELGHDLRDGQWRPARRSTVTSACSKGS